MTQAVILPTVGIVQSSAPSGFHWQITDPSGTHLLAAVDGSWQIQQVQVVTISGQEIRLIYWSSYGQSKQGLWICDSAYRFKGLNAISESLNLTEVEFCKSLLRTLLPRTGRLADSGENVSLRGLRNDGNFPSLAHNITQALLGLLRKEEESCEEIRSEIDSQLFSTSNLDRHKQWQIELLSKGCITVHLPGIEKPYQFRLPIIPSIDGFLHGYFDAEANACLLFTAHAGRSWLLLDFERLRVIASHRAAYPYITESIEQLVSHTLAHEAELYNFVAHGLTRNKTFVSCRDAHIGHYLWNDLTGLDYLDQAIASHADIDQSLLHVYVASRSIYGPLPYLFPNLTAAVPVTTAARQNMPGIVYAEKCQYLRACNDHITAVMAERLHNYALEYDWLHDWVPPGKAVDEELLIRLHLQENPPQEPAETAPPQLKVVCFYLRVNNRAPTNQLEFALALFSRLLQEQRVNADTQLFICGSNTDSGAVIRSHWESPGKSPDWVNEQKLAQRIIHDVKETFGHGNAFSLIGSPIHHELSVAHRADLILIPWGAGMAKTKWILNRKCLVHTSPWNLLHRPDLRIYEDTSMREGAVCDQYFPEDCVAMVYPKEWQELEQLDPEGYAMLANGFADKEPSRSNYRINIDPALNFICASLAEPIPAPTAL